MNIEIAFTYLEMFFPISRHNAKKAQTVLFQPLNSLAVQSRTVKHYYCGSQEMSEELRLD